MKWLHIVRLEIKQECHHLNWCNWLSYSMRILKFFDILQKSRQKIWIIWMNFLTRRKKIENDSEKKFAGGDNQFALFLTRHRHWRSRIPSAYWLFLETRVLWFLTSVFWRSICRGIDTQLLDNLTHIASSSIQSVVFTKVYSDIFPCVPNMQWDRQTEDVQSWQLRHL